MRSLHRNMIAAVALAAAAGALAACNTMAGAGEDMQQGGAALTNSADKHGAGPSDQTPAATTAPEQVTPPPAQPENAPAQPAPSSQY